jgi:hypothetical protein
MKKLHSLVLGSSAAALCWSTVSGSAGFITPRVPPPAMTPALATYAPKGLQTVRKVTTVNDDGPGSLRQVIADSAPGDMVEFALTLPATIVLSNTLFIAADLNVLGPGPEQLTVMRSDAPGMPDFRVFEIQSGVVTLAGITIRNGSAYSGTNAHDNLGGGILNLGNLTVSNCVITANSAPTTDWGPNPPNNGYRYSYGFGAGIFSNFGQLTVVNSTISGNLATAAGGGIATFETLPFSARGCTVSDNFAAIQGGGLNYQGRVGALENCTIARNATAPDGTGSGIASVAFEAELPTILTVTACTLASNEGTTNGVFGIVALNSGFGMTNRLLSTLVASNVGPNFTFVGTNTFESLGHNLDSDGSSGLVNGMNGDLVGTAATPIDAKLGPLQNNGGPTLTMALLAGSPAINAGSCLDATGNPILTDQRGTGRPPGGACDIGAFEYAPLSLTCPPGVVVEFTDENGAVATFNPVATSDCPPVTVVSTPPSGSVFPIGVTPVLVQAMDVCSNFAQCTFDVTVLGAQGAKSNVLAELVALRASAELDQSFAQKFDDAIAHLANSLNPAYWIDQTHLQPKGGNTAMNEEKLAANTLDGIMSSKQCPVDPAVLQGFINRIVKSDRLLAIISIEDAAAAGLNPKKIAEDLAMVAKGDAEAAAGRYANAIEHYRNAWRHALQLRLKVSLNPDGSAKIEFVANNSKSYLVEVSVDLVNWVPLGPCAADAQGNVRFTDANASHQAPRFYRVVEM